MDMLNYNVLKKSGYDGYVLEKAPEKVLQFGEGNFLRAFVDYFFDCANEKAGWNGKCVLMQPIAPGLAELINRQEGLYTLYLRGRENGQRVDRKRVISSVSRCMNPYEQAGYDQWMELAQSDDLEYIVSNTTEAGIVYDPESSYDQTPPHSFPAKLTKFLHKRFLAGKKGLAILSCELIDNNGKELQKCVERHIVDWKLGADFEAWVKNENLFCSTLVDRIVPGRIRSKDEVARLEAINGYHDELIDVGEVFGVWVIEGPAWLEDKLPFKKAGLNVSVVPDVTPYKKRKVRLLNGAHTGFVPGAYLSGENIVRDCMNNDVISGFMNKMLNDEIIPTVPLPREELDAFAASIKDRFNNPFIDHMLLDISLNSTSKWRARNLPSLKGYVEKTGKLPACLSASLAAYIAFYSDDVPRREENALICRRPAGNEYPVRDDAWVLDFYWEHRGDSVHDLVEAVLQNMQMWGEDLTKIPGLQALTEKNLTAIRKDGALSVFEAAQKER